MFGKPNSIYHTEFLTEFSIPLISSWISSSIVMETVTLLANTVNLDQTAPAGAVLQEGTHIAKMLLWGLA